MQHPNLTALDFTKRKGGKDGKGGGGNEDFQMTPDEAKRIEEKMKDPEFMKLWVEYAQSLADPKVREEEEEYLRQVEEEAKKGGDESFDFIFPKPCYAVELTNCPDAKKGHRVAVNICESDKVERFREETTGDRQGSHWYVPVSVGTARVEKISGTGDFEVYDAVFHPDTVSLANRSDKFMCFLTEIAVEHINGGYSRRFDFQFNRFPSDVKSIGTPKNQTVRRSSSDKSSSGEKPEVSLGPIKATFDDGRGSNTKTQQQQQQQRQQQPKPQTSQQKAAAAAPATSTGNVDITVAHRGEIDLTDAWNWSKLDKRIGIPRELVARIKLPGVERAAEIDIEIVKGVKIEVAVAARKLAGSKVLDFTVEEDPVTAKFDKTNKVLTLVLKVVPPPAPPSSKADEHLRTSQKQQNDDAKNGDDAAGDAAEDEAEDDDEEAARKKKLAEKKEQQQKASQETEDDRNNRSERVRHAYEALQTKKEDDAAAAAAAAAAAETKAKQQEAAAALRAKQDAWLKDEAARKAKSDAEAAAAAEQKRKEEAAAAAAATAAAEKKAADERAAAAAAAASAEEKKKKQQEKEAAAADASNLLLIDDDDDDFQLPSSQRAKLEDGAAIREAAKKAADAERQEELLQEELDKKMRELPLTNEYIFAID